MKHLIRAATLLLAACTGGSGTCPNNLPARCPPKPPSYTDVAPILDRSCALCHVAGGQAPTRPLDTYDAVYKLRGPALNQIYACTMPRDGVVLTPEDRLMLLTWFVCDAPR